LGREGEFELEQNMVPEVRSRGKENLRFTRGVVNLGLSTCEGAQKRYRHLARGEKGRAWKIGGKWERVQKSRGRRPGGKLLYSGDI